MLETIVANPDMNFVSQTLVVDYPCPKCKCWERDHKIMYDWVGRLQAREEPPIAYYRGQNNVLRVLKELLEFPLQEAIIPVVTARLGRYEPELST